MIVVHRTTAQGKTFEEWVVYSIGDLPCIRVRVWSVAWIRPHIVLPASKGILIIADSEVLCLGDMHVAIPYTESI